MDVAEQKFTLPLKVINYVSHSADYLMLRKLYMTAKYFPSECRVLIFGQVSVQSSDQPIFQCGKANLRFSLDHPKAATAVNLYIINTLSFQHAPCYALSSFLAPRIYRCEAKHLDIWNQDMTISDFKLLVNPDHIRLLYFEDVNVYGCKNKKFPLEAVIASCPLAVSITVNHVRGSNIVCTKRTTAILSEFQLDNKLQTFKVCGLTEDFNASEFVTFLRANAGPRARISLTFVPYLKRSYTENTRCILETTREYWWPRKDKPSIELNFL